MAPQAAPVLGSNRNPGPVNRPPRRCGLTQRSRPIARRASGVPGGFSLITLLAEANRMRDNQATLPIQHGGNQSAIRARLRLGNRPLLDFSAPLNGLGPPAGAVTAVRRVTDSIGRYPEPGSPRLVERLAEFHDVPADHIPRRRRHQRADQPRRSGAAGRPAPGLARRRRPRPPGLPPGRADLRRVPADGRPERTPHQGLGQPYAGLGPGVHAPGRPRDRLDLPPE